MLVLCPELSKIDSISHGFFTREGGVSEGALTSLNCGFGSGDMNVNVAKNRAFVMRALSAKTLSTPYQTHSNKALIVSEPWPDNEPPEADALATDVPGLAIGILTADCLPVLLADPKAGVVAAAHSGWKGATGGILESAIAAMESLGAKRKHTIATIGPGIEQCSYEVGTEFRERFLAESEAHAALFEPSSREGHYLFDLKAYARIRLEKAGVLQINILAHDTCLEETRFFSYRRSCLRNEKTYGRQVSAIMLKPTASAGWMEKILAAIGIKRKQL